MTTLKVNAQISTTNHSYFSITAEEYEISKNGRKIEISGGCLHDEILRRYPKYADFIALHLSDIDGVPMHAVENGYYYYQNPDKYNLQVLADHLRISLGHAKILTEELSSIVNNQERKARFAKYVLDQLPRWKAEADALIEKYKLVRP